jgi:hypothetical protein
VVASTNSSRATLWYHAQLGPVLSYASSPLQSARSIVVVLSSNGAQHAGDRAASERHGVLRRNRIVERRRVDDELLADEVTFLATSSTAPKMRSGDADSRGSARMFTATSSRSSARCRSSPRSAAAPPPSASRAARCCVGPASNTLDIAVPCRLLALIQPASPTRYLCRQACSLHTVEEWLLATLKEARGAESDA